MGDIKHAVRYLAKYKCLRNDPKLVKEVNKIAKELGIPIYLTEAEKKKIEEENTRLRKEKNKEYFGENWETIRRRRLVETENKFVPGTQARIIHPVRSNFNLNVGDHVYIIGRRRRVLGHLLVETSDG